MSTAVIGSRENCEQATTCKSLETIHNTFVCSQDEAHFIIFKESLYSIWTEFDNVSCSIWISNKVRLDTKLTIRVGRVTPEDINNELLFNRRDLVYNFKRSSNLFYLFKTNKSTSNTTVKANNSFLDNSSEWEPVKELINLVKNRIML